MLMGQDLKMTALACRVTVRVGRRGMFRVLRFEFRVVGNGVLIGDSVRGGSATGGQHSKRGSEVWDSYNSSLQRGGILVVLDNHGFTGAVIYCGRED